MSQGMDKGRIVAILEEIGLLLELKAENPFKIRAYQNGARALETMEEPLDQVIEEDRLGTVPGIGKALIEKITTLYETGELAYYTDLKASVPEGLVGMLEIPNFGPKKIQKVYQELGIDTMAKLKAACEAGELAALSGFGKKTEEKILKGMENLVAYAARHLWWDVKAVAEPIAAGLRGLEVVEAVEIAGSFRRGRETVGDLDFIVGSAHPKEVMDWFVSLEAVVEISAKGETKSSVRFEGGLQADLRVVPMAQFPFALHHFTGSKEHNVQMRQRALERGWSMSEWGLFDKEDGTEEKAGGGGRKLVVEGVRTETDLFRVLDMDFVPPALREGRGEVDASAKGILPELIEMKDIRGVFHNHTTASDGRSTIEEMAIEAGKRGWAYFGLADHSKSSFQANGLSEERLRTQIETVRKLNASGHLPVHVFAGSEVDILRDGSLDYSDELLNELDYVVISVHASMTGLSEKEMTDRIIQAMSHPLKVKKMLGHLTGRLLLKREGYAVDVPTIIEAAVEYGVVIELNANPHRLDMDWRWWQRAAEAGVLCAINPDAHAPEHFDFMEAGVIAARKGWLRSEMVLNTRGLAGIETFLS